MNLLDRFRELVSSSARLLDEEVAGLVVTVLQVGDGGVAGAARRANAVRADALSRRRRTACGAAAPSQTRRPS
jgi:hypothetical protein